MRSVAIPQDDPRVAWPIFTIQETADYLNLPSSTVRNWARTEGHGAAITAFPRKGHQATVPFIGFAEAFVLKALRRAGMKDKRIRDGVRAAQERFGIEHALASRRLFTDGSELLWGVVSDDLEVLRTNQKQFTETVRNELQLITYADDDGYAARIRLPQFETTKVVVDPDVAFGYPLIEPGGVPVKDVLSRWWAGEPMTSIAGDFDLPRESVEEVIRAQTRPALGIAA